MVLINNNFEIIALIFLPLSSILVYFLVRLWINYAIDNSLLDKPNIRARIKLLKKQMKAATPPDFCYDNVPDGKSGNMKLARSCVYCRHKFVCHKDSNIGMGLRVFKYAKKFEYLTNVAKLPRVQEVTHEWKKTQKAT